MGMERSLKVAQGRRRTKFGTMQQIVDEAIDEGYLGLSIDMLPWHRLDGEPFCGISVPSQHAASAANTAAWPTPFAAATACCRPRPTR